MATITLYLSLISEGVSGSWPQIVWEVTEPSLGTVANGNTNDDGSTYASPAGWNAIGTPPFSQPRGPFLTPNSVDMFFPNDIAFGLYTVNYKTWDYDPNTGQGTQIQGWYQATFRMTADGPLAPPPPGSNPPSCG